MRLYLDDLRTIDVEGVTIVRSVEAAILAVQEALAAGERFEMASLDHDLGACSACHEAYNHEVVKWFTLGEARPALPMPYCGHVGTGLTFVDWMTEHGIWPDRKPMVHSQNPVGAERMRAAINRDLSDQARETIMIRHLLSRFWYLVNRVETRLRVRPCVIEIYGHAPGRRELLAIWHCRERNVDLFERSLYQHWAWWYQDQWWTQVVRAVYIGRIEIAARPKVRLTGHVFS